MRLLMRTSCLMTLLLLHAAAASAYSRTILDLKPLSRVESSESATKRFLLTPQERADRRITIVEIDGKYFWATREHRELFHTSGGAVHYFISPEGSGTIKVIDTHYLYRDPKDKSPRWIVIEQVGIISTTITYWGRTEEFHDEYLE